MKSAKFLGIFLLGALGAQARMVDRVSAVVGDQPILWSEVQSFKKELTGNRALANIYRMNPEKISEKDILDRMIEEKIVSLSVKEYDALVTDLEVENQIQTIAKQNNITKERLFESLKGEKISLETYRKNIRAQLEKRNIFDRELRRNAGGGASDPELRAVYNERAPREFKLSLIALRKSAATRDRMKSILDESKKADVSLGKLGEKYGADSLGWVTLDTLNPKFAKLIQSSHPGQVIGPLEEKGQLNLFLFEAERRGSEEGFEKMKDQLASQVQSQDFDRRFDNWIDRRKKDLHIVVNGT